MVREDRSSWKANYFLKLVELFEDYPKCFIVGVDNVGSKQMQEIRSAMRGMFYLSYFYYVVICRPCCYFDGKEHDDPQSYSRTFGQESQLGEDSPTHCSKCWICLHKGGSV